ncbi:hypothetical protein Gogos_011217, partial [Gossypium gossypioides]|nr:hypothetical protein [Gossypium gossypioides]
IRVELGLEPLVEIEVTNEYGWAQSEQTNEFITPCPVFDNENFIDDGNEVISNHQTQINMEQIRSLEVPNIGIEDQNQSYQNIGIDNDPAVPDEGSNQQNIVAVEWSDLYNLCRFINQQLAAGAEIEFPNLPPLDVAESSYSTDSVRKRSAMEVERLATGVETELAQQQAKRSRL